MSLQLRKLAHSFIKAKKAYKLLPKKEPVVWKPNLFDGLRRTEHILKSLQAGPKTRRQLWDSIKDTNCGIKSTRKMSNLLSVLIKARRIKAAINLDVSNKHFAFNIRKNSTENKVAFENIKAGQQVGRKKWEEPLPPKPEPPKEITSLPIQLLRKDGKPKSIPYQGIHIPEYLESLAKKQMQVEKRIQREKQADLVKQTLKIRQAQAKEKKEQRKAREEKKATQKATA